MTHFFIWDEYHKDYKPLIDSTDPEFIRNLKQDPCIQEYDICWIAW